MKSIFAVLIFISSIGIISAQDILFYKNTGEVQILDLAEIQYLEFSDTPSAINLRKTDNSIIVVLLAEIDSIKFSGNRSKNIISFSVNGIQGIINESQKTITVTMPFNTNLSELTAEFVSTGKTVEIAGTLQTSGITVNDFSRTQIYRVTAADSSTKDYLVSVLSLPRDQNGWTIFTPSSDSRILYVSGNGNDLSGTVYSSGQIADPFNPGQINAFATYEAAYSLTRSGYPDWILLNRGDTIKTNISMRSGRNEYEYSLIGSYGPGLSMPVVWPADINTAALSIPSTNAYSAVSGVEFCALNRDPSGAGYSVDGTIGIRAVTNRTITNILLEGCVFRFFTGNQIQSTDGGICSNIVIRRSLFLDNYSTGVGHSQGLYMAFANGVLLEENIFDHNGWYSKSPGLPGTATMFNHNTYFEGCHNVIFARNIFLRGSSMGNKFTANLGEASSTNISIKDNLYADGEIGIGLGGNTVGQYRFRNISVEGNVFTEIGRSQPTSRTLGWGLDAVGWNTGNISGNLFLNFSNPVVTNIYGLRVEGGSANIRIDNNVFYNLNPHGNSSNAPAILFADTRTIPTDGVIVKNNFISEPVNQFRVFQADAADDITLFSFTHNKYYTPNENTAFSVEGSIGNFSLWKGITNDNSEFTESCFEQPSGSIETYMQSLDLEPSIDEFIKRCRMQNRFYHDSSFDAETILNWLKAGFF